MKYSKLGYTDIEVSKICLGTMTYGEQNSEKEAHEQLNYAIDKGVNFIDTAELYAVPSRKETQGLTEKYIGTWLTNRRDRDKIIIGTKVAGPAPNLKYIRNNIGFSAAAIHEAVDLSLQRLQTDYIDLYQLHWPDRGSNMFGQRDYTHNPTWKDNIGEVVSTLKQLQDAGKIRYYGLSNETPWGTMRHLAETSTANMSRPVSIQNPYSLLNRTLEIGLSEVAIREQIGILAYSPLGMGLLSGKYHKGTDKPENRLNQYKNRMSRYLGEIPHNATTQYLAVAEKHDLSLTQLALGFVNTRPFMISNIIGATTMEQLKENIDSIDVNITDEILKDINEVHERIPNPAP